MSIPIAIVHLLQDLGSSGFTKRGMNSLMLVSLSRDCPPYAPFLRLHVQCIANCSERFLDTSMFVANRIQQKQEKKH